MKYSWALGTALLWAISPSLAKLGVATGTPASVGTLIALLATAPFVYVAATALGNRPRLGRMDRDALLATIANGVLNSLATFSYYIALRLELVSVVVAVSCFANTLVNLLLVRLFVKDEILSTEMVIGTVLAVAGTLIIVL